MESINITKLQNSKKANKICNIAKGLRVPFQTKQKYVKKHYTKKLTDVIIQEIDGFPRKFSTVQENAAKPMVWGKSEKSIIILFRWRGCFFPIRFTSYGILHHMAMHEFPHQFLIVWENATKLIVWGENEKLVLILFPYYGRIFSIRFPF